MQTTGSTSLGAVPADETAARRNELLAERPLLMQRCDAEFRARATAAIGQVQGMHAFELTGGPPWARSLLTNTEDFRVPLWTARLDGGIVVAQIPHIASTDGSTTVHLSALTAFTDRGECAATRALFVPKNAGRCTRDCPVLTTFPVSGDTVRALDAFYDLVPRDILVTITARLEAFFASTAGDVVDASILAPVVGALRAMLRPVAP